MGEMITKPDANPILYAILDVFPFPLVPIGHFMMGQSGKAVVFLVYTLVLSCIGVGMLIPILAAVDAYILGKKLQSGESIGMKENGLAFLDNLPGFK